MYPASNVRQRLSCVGNYELTGRILGKGHFAKVKEAQHKLLGKKVALKVIDIDLVHEEYVKKNLQREAKVMARLRHPCIAMLYETMMCGNRYYIAMEAASGGDLHTYVLASTRTRSTTFALRGIHEECARNIAIQLVSAISHMHSCGVVHRDLKMENVMLDNAKQNIKIVDFGLSNLYTKEGGLSTPCGSLEYAAPELFLDGKKYGSEVDLWSLGVIVYGMVSGSLPFRTPALPDNSGESRQRPQLQRAIAKGFGVKQKQALSHTSSGCRSFVQLLLQPNMALRMTVYQAGHHAWIKKGNRVVNANPFPELSPASLKMIYKSISGHFGLTLEDVIRRIKAKPYSVIGGIFNIQVHHHLLMWAAGREQLWISSTSKPELACDSLSSLDNPYLKANSINSVIITAQPIPDGHKRRDERMQVTKNIPEKRPKRSANQTRPKTTDPLPTTNAFDSIRAKTSRLEDPHSLWRAACTVKSAQFAANKPKLLKQVLPLRSTASVLVTGAALSPCCVASSLSTSRRSRRPMK